MGLPGRGGDQWGRTWPNQPRPRWPSHIPASELQTTEVEPENDYTEEDISLSITVSEVESYLRAARRHERYGDFRKALEARNTEEYSFDVGTSGVGLGPISLDPDGHHGPWPLVPRPVGSYD